MADLSLSDRWRLERRLDRMQGIAWALITATFLVVYGLVVVAALESWK